MRVPGTGQSVFGDPTKTGGFGGERHGTGIEAVSIRCRCILLTEARARACVIFQHASIPKITLQNILVFSDSAMAARKVLRLGNPILREKSVEVTEEEVRTKEFKKLVGDMFDTMRFENGVGLAAPQIGVLKKLVIVGIEEDNPRYPDAPRIKEQILINPKITPLAGNGKGYWEGCLSVPGMRGFVERPYKIRVEYRDLKWKEHSEIIEGFPAIVYQHECDHLEGILYVDRLKSSKLFGYTEEVDTKGDELD